MQMEEVQHLLLKQQLKLENILLLNGIQIVRELVLIIMREPHIRLAQVQLYMQDILLQIVEVVLT